MENLLQDYLSYGANLEIKTPYYLYFPSEVRRTITTFKRLLDNDVGIFYAIKSNNYEGLVKELIKNDFGFDVASKEEIEFLHKLGADMGKIAFSNPSKEEDALVLADKLGIKYYAFDSEEEIKKIHRLVKDPILVGRMTSSNQDAIVELSSKFGMTYDYFKYLVDKAKSEGWNIQGLTFHVGSQNTKLDAWYEEVKRIYELLDYAKSCGLEIKYLDIGGGIPAPYDSTIEDLNLFIDALLSVEEMLSRDFPEIEVSVEPGRGLSANSMALVTRVIDIKPYKNPPVVVADTGVFNGMIEAIQGFDYPVFTGHLDDSKGYSTFRIAGFSCDSWDVLKKEVDLPKAIKVGDLIVFMYAGAYTLVYEHFHMVPYPSITTFPGKSS